MFIADFDGHFSAVRAKIAAIMKLHTTSTQQYQTVTGYEENWVEINAVRYDHSLLVLPEQAPKIWDVAASHHSRLRISQKLQP